jgi:hypothetical protein
MDGIGRGNRRDMGRESGTGIEHGRRARKSGMGVASARVLTAAAFVSAALAGATEAAHATDCPPESPPRLYHPRPLVKLGGLGQCSTELDSFEKAAWHAGFGAGSDQLGVLGVNVHGEIVGTEIASGNCLRPRPFVYLPVAKYGKSAGKHDLITWSGGSSEDVGYAWDITDDGLVVGGVGGRPDTLADGACRAIAWDLADGCATIALDASPDARNVWSMAIAAEPYPEPNEEVRIVGVTGYTCPLWRRNARFLLATNTSAIVHDAQPPAYGLHSLYHRALRSWACDVANFANPVGGFDWPSAIDPDDYQPNVNCPEPWSAASSSCDLPFWCGAQFRWATGWPFTDFYRRDPSVSPPEAIAGQQTRVRSISHDAAVNSAIDDFVVAGQFRTPAAICRWLPALWKYGMPDTAIELPLPDGVDDATAQRWRESAGECGPDVVIGWRTGVDRTNGVVWSRCAASGPWDFCVDAADNLTPQNDIDTGFDILQIYEVFDSGEMLAIVRDSVSAEGSRGHYAAILGLAGDFNRDWAVGSPDLAMLLSSWGSTTSMELDLSQDGSVNSPDLTALLSLWTGSAQRALALSCGAEFCLPEGESLAERTEGSPDDALAHALAAFGFESVDAFRAAAIELDQAQLDFICHAMRCFMQAYSENLQ